MRGNQKYEKLETEVSENGGRENERRSDVPASIPYYMSRKWRWSFISFSWVNDIIRNAFQGSLTYDDLLRMPNEYLPAEKMESIKSQLNQGGIEKNLFSIIHREWWFPFWVAGFFRLMSDLAAVTTPLILRELLISISTENRYTNLFPK